MGRVWENEVTKGNLGMMTSTRPGLGNHKTLDLISMCGLWVGMMVGMGRGREEMWIQ